MEEIDLKELFQIFWDKKISMIIIVTLFIIIGMIYSYAYITPVYTSATTLVLTKVNSEDKQTSQTTQQTTESITTSDIILNSQLVSTYSELVKSKKVLRKVISNLNSDISENELRRSVSVSSVKDTEFIEIDVTNANPVLAAQFANEIAKVFTENVTEIYSINNIHIIDDAEASNSPSNINHKKDCVIFAFLGIVAGAMYVLLLNMFDTTIKSPQDIEKITKLSVLVTFPYYDYNGNDKKGGKK